MSRITKRCPKCGDSWSSNTPSTYVTCRCGTKFNLEDGECEHGKRKGQCSNPKCEFANK